MESSIAVFLKRQIAFEQLPTQGRCMCAQRPVSLFAHEAYILCPLISDHQCLYLTNHDESFRDQACQTYMLSAWHEPRQVWPSPTLDTSVGDHACHKICHFRFLLISELCTSAYSRHILQRSCLSSTNRHTHGLYLVRSFQRSSLSVS